MPRLADVNRQFIASRHAQVAMEDRGYQFADGVYEVIARYDGYLIDAKEHLDRLERSLDELMIPMPFSRRAMEVRLNELLRRSKKLNGLVYIQVTRGVAARNHLFNKAMQPVFTATVYPAKYPSAKERSEGAKIITHKDERWARCDVKSIALLPNVLARQKAADAGAREAWQINAAGQVTEGALSNAYLVIDGTIVTHPADHAILGGITRETVLRLARERQLRIEERPFTIDDIANASEAFMSSASSFVLGITRIDGQAVGSGKVGDVSKQLYEDYMQHISTQGMWL